MLNFYFLIKLRVSRSVHGSLYDLWPARVIFIFVFEVVAPLMVRCHHDITMFGCLLRKLDHILINLVVSCTCLLAIAHANSYTGGAIAISQR